MKRFNKTILFIHRWLGLITGLVVFIVSITGCIFCFQDEIQDALFSYRKVEIKDRPYLPPSVLKEAALKLVPAAEVSYIYYYGKDRPAAVLAANAKDGLQYVYLDPYTGEVTHHEKLMDNFFTVVEFIHLYLLLPAKVGGPVVGISVIIFLLIMVTGVILWWPKRKTDRKRSFTIKWKGRWRRVNYDLHNVLGFYVTSIALVLGITGLAINFDWVNRGMYATANLGKTYPAEKTLPVSDTLYKSLPVKKPAIDQAFLVSQHLSPKAQMFLIYDDHSLRGTIGITAYAQSLHYYKSDSYTFDKYNAKLLSTLHQAQKSPGKKLNDMNYDVHVGQIAGLTGKIVAFLASLICASLPVTGFIIWLGKQKNAPAKKAKAVIHARIQKKYRQ